jgi:hypothetical protein
MTTRQVEIHPEALAEAEAAITWYGVRSSRAHVLLQPSWKKSKMRFDRLLMLRGDGQSMSRTAAVCLYFVSHTPLSIAKKLTV